MSRWVIWPMFCIHSNRNSGRYFDKMVGIVFSSSFEISEIFFWRYRICNVLPAATYNKFKNEMQRNTEFSFNKILGFEKFVYSCCGNYVIICDKSFVKHDRLHSASIFTRLKWKEPNPVCRCCSPLFCASPLLFSSPLNMNLVAHLGSAASRG